MNKLMLKIKSSYAVLFQYFFIISIIILSISLIPTYFFMANKLKQEQYASNELLLQQIQTNADIMLKQIDNVSVRALVNQNLLSIFFKNYYSLYDDLEEYFNDVSKLNQVLNGEKYNNPYIKSIYLYIPKSDLVLTENTVFHFKEFPEKSFINSLMSKTKYSGWIGPRQVDIEQEDEYIDIPSGKVISLYRKIPISGNLNMNALLIINVDINAFNKLIKNPEKYSNLQFYLSNPSGDIVASYNNTITGNLIQKGLDPTNFAGKKNFWEQSIKGQTMMISCVMSEYTDWRYLVMLPKSVVLASLYQMQKLIFGLLAACFLLSIFLSYLLSKKYYRPIKKLVYDVVPNSQLVMGRARDDFSALNTAFSNIVSERNYSREIIKNNWNLIKDKYIYDILNGNQNWDKDILDFDFKYKYFRTICFEPDSIYKYPQPRSEMDKSLALHNMERICQDIFNSNPKEIYALTAKINDKMLVVILNYNDTSENHMLTENLEIFKSNIYSALNESCTIGVGRVYDERGMIPYSYREAVDAIKYKVFMGYGQVIYFDPERFKRISDYDETRLINKKNQLIENIKLKNHNMVTVIIEEIKDLLSGISLENFDRIKFMFAGMCQEINKSIYNTGYEDSGIFDEMFRSYKNIESSQCINDLISVLKTLSGAIISHLIDKTEKISDEILSSILAYLQQHYNEDIGIEFIADKMKFNAAYLGRLIKNATGCTFPQYITQLRIEKAKVLINDSNEKINEIYEKVGYTNRQSFFRAFKLYTGMTPSDFRQSEAQKALKTNNVK